MFHMYFSALEDIDLDKNVTWPIRNKLSRRNAPRASNKETIPNRPKLNTLYLQ